MTASMAVESGSPSVPFGIAEITRSGWSATSLKVIRPPIE